MAGAKGAASERSNRRSQGPQRGPGVHLRHHRSVAREVLQQLVRFPVSLLLSWSVIAIALALPTLFMLLMSNVQVLARGLDGIPRISLYLQLDLGESRRLELQQQLQAQPGIDSVRYISPQQALDDFQQSSGLTDVLAGLEGNPLPAVLSARIQLSDPERLATLEQQLSAWPGVDQVQLDRAWILKLHSMLLFGQRLAWALGLMLAAGVLLIIGNTTRLAIERRRDEILVVKLVGGSNAYVRRPFLYLGFWLGLGGALLALLLVSLLLLLLDGPIAQLVQLYAGAFHLHGLGLSGAALLLLLGTLLGWLGALLSCNRHLRDIEPS